MVKTEINSSQEEGPKSLPIPGHQDRILGTYDSTEVEVSSSQLDWPSDTAF